MSSAKPNNHPDPKLREAQDRFIATWGQMGSAWGISRTIAEIHALLFIVAQPLCTDDVMERLEISRGNASMSLRALLDWGIIAKVHKRGDRKEYFEAEHHVPTMFQTIARERKKRELDPVIASLYEIRDITSKSPASDKPIAAHNQRLDNMLDFISLLDQLAQAMVSPDADGLESFMSMLNSAK
ncbi:MAG: ArsR family transcriptional regulator [Phycisphaerales bacterium]|nr:ArsR family transcriptional regulator [Phycisphaerales bacterium]